MCPLIRELINENVFKVKVMFTGQHREIADEAMGLFGITPDYDMNIMRESQSLFDITENILSGARDILFRENPLGVIVHGDTTTAFAVSLAAFYMGVPVFHVEAGLRSHCPRSPFPEEFNRRSVALMAALHFAPTHTAVENLLNEGVSRDNIVLTGNTVIDSMKYTLREDFECPYLPKAGERLIFLTAHRRESLGKPLENMLSAVRELAESYSDVRFLYPVHPNPAVKGTAERILGGCERVTLCPPLGVLECHNIMARSYMLMTDSGGIQEEAAALGKPVIVMRNVTERQEGILSGLARLGGTDKYQIIATAKELLECEDTYERMCLSKNPYGDGTACVKISKALSNMLI